MKYDEVIEAIKAGIKYKKLMADAGGGGGAGAGGGAAGGSGGASAGASSSGGSATSSSGDGGSADGGGSDATPSADSTSSETTSRGGYFAGYGGYWGSKGSKKKKKKKTKVGSVKDGIYEGDVIDAQDKFKQKQSRGDMFAIHIFSTDASGRADWIKPFRFRNQYEVSRNIQSQLNKGVKPEHIKVEFNGKFINMPEFGITENINNLQEQPDIKALEDKLYKLEGALGMARETTRDIKYVDTHVEIVSKLGGIAEDVGIQLDEYQERKVYEAKNTLESEVYQLEEVFEDAIRDIQNKIDELEFED
jgi:hypothetical protein